MVEGPIRFPAHGVRSGELPTPPSALRAATSPFRGGAGFSPPDLRGRWQPQADGGECGWVLPGEGVPKEPLHHLRRSPSPSKLGEDLSFILPGTGRGTARSGVEGPKRFLARQPRSGELSTPPSALRAATSPFRGGAGFSPPLTAGVCLHEVGSAAWLRRHTLGGVGEGGDGAFVRTGQAPRGSRRNVPGARSDRVCSVRPGALYAGACHRSDPGAISRAARAARSWSATSPSAATRRSPCRR